MGLYPSPVAENNSPSTPYNGPNVSQYGWTEQETGYYVQLREYVEKCEDILDECEDIRDNLTGQADLVEDMYNEILVIKQDMDSQMEEFNEDMVDFETKYSDFLSKYNQIVSIHAEIVTLHEETLDAAAQAAASASTAIDAATEAEGYAQTALGYAQAADFDAAFASDEADRAQGYAEKLEHAYEDMGTHTIIQGYPIIPEFSSMWYITDGGPDPEDPAIIWNPGDQLLYSKRTGLWSRLTGQSLGGGETVPIEILDDLVMQQGKKIRFRVDDFIDHDGMSLDSDGDLVVGEIPTTDNTMAPLAKIGFAATELYHITGMGTGSVTTKHRIYDQGFKPTPSEIGAVKKAGDTMTGTLTAPSVKVVAAPVATEDLANKGYVDSKAGSKTYFGETPPANVPVGSMWYCTGNGLTYIYYNDGNSSQWIEANPNYPSAVGDHNHDEYVKKSGDTMTGKLIVDADVDAITIKASESQASYMKGEVGASRAWWVGKGSSTSNDISLHSDLNSNTITLGSNYTTIAKDPRTGAQQGLEINSLTRKDYVNAEDAKRLSLTGGTLTGNLIVNTSGSNQRISLGSGDNTGLFRINNSMYVSGYNSTDGKVILEGQTNPQAKVGTTTYTLYHQGFKPTATDVGAVSATDKSYWHKIGMASTITDLNSAALANPGYFSYSSSGVNAAPSAAYGHGFTWGPGGDAANGIWYSQMVADHQGKLWYRNGINTAATGSWNKIYTSVDKPTAAEVGAAPVSHTHNAVADIAGILEALFPVGSTLYRVDTIAPNTLGFPGTWTKVAAGVTLATGLADGSDVGTTAGTNTPAVPVPSHTHTATQAAHSHTATQPQHSHTVNARIRGDFLTGSVAGAQGGGASEHHTDTNLYPTTSAVAPAITVDGATPAITVAAAGVSSPTIDVQGLHLNGTLWIRTA